MVNKRGFMTDSVDADAYYGSDDSQTDEFDVSFLDDDTEAKA